MEMRQLELDLWQSLDVAVRYPETANVQRLCDALEGAIADHPLQEQLQIAGELLRQISEVYAARAAWLMDGWEYRHNPQEPIVALDDDANFFAQSLSLELNDLFEEPEAVMYPSERRSRSAPQGTIVGELDKEALLNALDERLAEHPGMIETEAFEAAISVAHGENVSEWVGAIDQVLREQDGEQSGEQTLSALQERLRMPWVEVWLAVLLGEYWVEQRGEFYQRETIWVGAIAQTLAEQGLRQELQ
jgi:hypothetical protein